MSNQAQPKRGAQLRSYKNILINPRAQMKYSFVFFGGGILLMAGFLILFLYTFNQNIVNVTAAYAIDPEVSLALRNSLTSAAVAVLFFAFALSGLMMFAGITLSHRVYGPMVPIRRLIKDLINGNYKARGTVRAKDEFQDVMADLNTLASKLESRHVEKAE